MAEIKIDKIICLGKNYLEHAKELGDKVPEKPVLFLKPPSVLRQAKNNEKLSLKIPQNRGALHFECELAFRVDKNKELSHFSLGLDMTLRDVQSELKKNGHPWEIGKVFVDSLVIGPWFRIDSLNEILNIDFEFKINNIKKQKSRGKNMRFSPLECLSLASEHFPICDGDILMTGTPEGVGAIQTGDKGELIFGSLINYFVEWK